MKREGAIITASVAILLAIIGILLFGDALLGKKEAIVQNFQQGSPVAAESYPEVALKISDAIDQVSPTGSYQSRGWIVKRITFLSGKNEAYVEYTDTHIALRLLIEFSYASPDGRLETHVLATFIPNELGGWNVQNGVDDMRTGGNFVYVFDAAVEKWIPETMDK